MPADDHSLNQLLFKSISFTLFQNVVTNYLGSLCDYVALVIPQVSNVETLDLNNNLYLGVLG